MILPQDGLQQRQGGERERLHAGHPAAPEAATTAEAFQLFLFADVHVRILVSGILVDPLRGLRHQLRPVLAR